MSTAVRYVAEPRHVREATLSGAADLGFWKDRLSKEDLIPAEQDGKARILIIAARMRFKGIRFTEVSFSVLLKQPGQEAARNAAFLAQAFNTCRLFAFCERALFAAPYSHGDCRVSVASPVSIRLIERGEAVFRAEMRGDASMQGRQPSRSGEEGWEGSVFLPRSGRGRSRQGSFYFARIRGLTRAYPFLPDEDAVAIRPSTGAGILQALLDSRFVGEEWAVRDDATHARSRTHKRS